MNAKLTIQMDNAAFADDGADGLNELARILRNAAYRLERGHDGFWLTDVCGNRVGELAIQD